MGIKILIGVIIAVLIFSSGLLFTVSGIIFTCPEILCGKIGKRLAALCIANGVLFLIPVIISAVLAAVSLIEKSKEKRSDHT